MKRRRSIAVVAVTAALLIAGCSGAANPATTADDPGPTTTDRTPTDSPSTTPEATPDPAASETPPGTHSPASSTDPTDTPVPETTTGRTPVGPPGEDPLLDAVESYVFDHYGVGGAAIDGGIRFSGDSTGRKYYVTVVGSAAEAERFDDSVLDDGAGSFVADTSFADAYIVVVQAFPASSAPDYRVEGVERTDRGLHVRINDSSGYGTNDETVETLLVRVPRDGPVPEVVRVTTEDGVEFDTTTGVVGRDSEDDDADAG